MNKIIKTLILVAITNFANAQIKDTTVKQGRIYLNKNSEFKKDYKFTNLSVVNNNVTFYSKDNQKISLNISKVREIDSYKKGDQRWLFTAICGGVSLITSTYLTTKKINECKKDPNCTSNYTSLYPVGGGIAIGSGLVGYLIGKSMKKVKVIYFKP